MDQPAEILVRGPNWTGDLIMASPGFRALRAGFPDARITLHVREALLPLVAGAPWFDAVRPVTSWRGGLRAQLGEARALRAGGFDLGVCLPDSFSSALLMRLSGVRRVVGYARGVRRWLLHTRVAWPSEVIARERHVLGLVTALGCAELGTDLELFVTEEERAEADRLLPDDAAPLAVIAPGASFGPSKLWPAESFARVGDRLAEEGAQVALAGTAGEASLTGRIASGMGAPALDLAGRLSLGGLKALLSRASVLVCNDAGARHVGVAFGVPAVVMMGPTALEKTNLNLERVRVWTADVPCRPCYQRECPIDHRCMTRIPPGVVAADAAAGLHAGRHGAFAGEVRLLPAEDTPARRVKDAAA